MRVATVAPANCPECRLKRRQKRVVAAATNIAKGRKKRVARIGSPAVVRETLIIAAPAPRSAQKMAASKIAWSVYAELDFADECCPRRNGITQATTTGSRKTKRITLFELSATNKLTEVMTELASAAQRITLLFLFAAMGRFTGVPLTSYSGSAI